MCLAQSVTDGWMPGRLQELTALASELQEATKQQLPDPFLLYLHGLVEIDRCRGCHLLLTCAALLWQC